MRIYLINLDRRPDRLAAMTQRAGALGLELARIPAVDAAGAGGELDRWFEDSGPLGEIPRGDKACLLSHRLAWQAFLDGSHHHAVVLEDDVVLSRAAGALLADESWLPDAPVVKLEHYGPPGQRVLLTNLRGGPPGFQLGRMQSRHTGAAAYVLTRAAAQTLLDQTRFALPVDHLLFNPNISPLFAPLAPVQLLPAIARQEQFVGAKSDIESTRVGLRRLNATYVKRELVRFGHDLKRVPRQVAALLGGAQFRSMTTAP